MAPSLLVLSLVAAGSERGDEGVGGGAECSSRLSEILMFVADRVEVGRGEAERDALDYMEEAAAAQQQRQRQLSGGSGGGMGTRRMRERQ